MTTGPWQRARAEHDAALAQFGAVLHRVGVDGWHREPAPGQWSPAAVALHVADSYRFGRDAARAGGGGMRMRAAPWQAWLGRHVLFPVMLWRRTFPRGARAPAEVRPDLAAAARMTREEAIAQVRLVAEDAATALQDASPTARIAHAYFGPLPPLKVLRLLSAHTCHHARMLSAALPHEHRTP